MFLNTGLTILQVKLCWKVLDQFIRKYVNIRDSNPYVYGAKIETNDVLIIENEYLFEDNSQISISFWMFDLFEGYEIMTLKQGSKTIA